MSMTMGIVLVVFLAARIAVVPSHHNDINVESGPTRRRNRNTVRDLPSVVAKHNVNILCLRHSRDRAVLA